MGRETIPSTTFPNVLGNAALPRLNVQEELARIKHDPMSGLILKLQRLKPNGFDAQIERYKSAYNLYFLSAERLLPEASIARRWRNGPYIAERDHLRAPAEWRALSRRYHAIANYIDLDFYNLVLHSPILLDRTIGFSRYFIKGSRMPSFSSF